MANKYKNIAVLCGEPLDPYSHEILKGAFNASKDMEVNLIVVPGKYYGNDISDFESQFEYQYTSLYSFINGKNVDAAVILTGAIGPFSDDPSSRNYFPRFKDKFKGLPVVSIASDVEGWSLIKYDNKNAIKEGVEYLIEEQHCKHIAMVTGEANSEDAIERLNAYKEALLENDMEINENLIVYGNFTRRSKNLIRDLIEQHPNVDAIVFGNDEMALAGYDVMKDLNLQVGRDIAFLGFDDSINAVRMNIPLASVRADAAELGYEAVKLACTVSDFNIIKQLKLPTQLIIRESMQKNAIKKDLAEIFRDEEFDIDTQFTSKSLEIYEYLIDKRNNHINHDIVMNRYVNVANELESLFSLRELRDNDFQRLENAFFRFLSSFNRNDMDATKFIRILDRIMEYMSETKEDEYSKSVISRATARIFRRMVEQIDNSSEQKIQSDKDMFHNANMISKSMFLFDSGSNQSYSQILSSLPKIGINNSVLVMYEKPITYLITDNFQVPETLYIRAVQHKDNVFVPSNKDRAISFDELFERCIDLTEETERKDYIMLSLFADEVNYGFLLCDLSFDYYSCAEALVNQGSNAIKMLNLLQEQEETSSQLELSLELLQKHNIELNEMANKDELTGIYNRRGFLNTTQEALDNPENIDRYALVAYADTDNLKIINDRYGHEGGDFALTSCSNILFKVFSDGGMIGRIGGDEFAIVVIVDEVEAQDKYQKLLEDATNELNSNSGKEYNVKMSVGMTMVKIKKGMQIADLLDKADALLYKKKKTRRKEILKSELEN